MQPTKDRSLAWIEHLFRRSDRMGFFRSTDGDIIDGENDILSKYELMYVLKISRSTIQRYMKQGLPHVYFENGVGFNLLETQDWLERHKSIPPESLRKRWAEHRTFMRKLDG